MNETQSTMTIQPVMPVTLMLVLRRKLGLSQYALSRLTGVAQPTISWVERGESASQVQIGALAHFFEIPVEDLQMDYAEYVLREQKEAAG